MESDWNAIVDASCKNPFMLSEFARQFINFNRSTGWTPLVLLVSAKNKVVGIVPLMAKKKFGVRSVKFVYNSAFSPDFIISNQHRETCIAHILEFLFKTFVSSITQSALRTIDNVPIQKCPVKETRVDTTPE